MNRWIANTVRWEMRIFIVLLITTQNRKVSMQVFRCRVCLALKESKNQVFTNDYRSVEITFVVPIENRVIPVI